MKLSNKVIQLLLLILSFTVIDVGCESRFKASGETWMVEAGASTKAQFKK